MRDWKPGDIFDVTCPWCKQATVEFFKDESRRNCPACHKPIKNPRIDMGCLKWCPFSKECQGVQRDDKKTE